MAESRGQSQASPGPCQVLTWGTCEPLRLSPKSSAPASYLCMGVKTCRRHTEHQREVPGSEPGKGEPSSAMLVDTPTVPVRVLGPQLILPTPDGCPCWQPGGQGLSPISSGERAAGGGVGSRAHLGAARFNRESKNRRPRVEVTPRDSTGQRQDPRSRTPSYSAFPTARTMPSWPSAPA